MEFTPEEKELAFMLCEKHNINPEAETISLRESTRETLGEKYKLWEYQAAFYVAPILRNFLTTP